ncbi:MAG: hypothetical protein RSE41_09645 [Clostridia bacterium]
MPKVRVYDEKDFCKEFPCSKEELNQTIFECMQMYDDCSVDVEEDNGVCWCPY